MRGITLFMVVTLALAGCDCCKDGCELHGEDLSDCEFSFVDLDILSQGTVMKQTAINCEKIIGFTQGEEPHGLDHTYLLVEGVDGYLLVPDSFDKVTSEIGAACGFVLVEDPIDD